MAPAPHDVFVPNGDSRRETAVLLVGTAEEYGISQRSIKTAPGGFFITEELADIVYDDVDKDVAPEPEPTKKASGNRAAKNSTVKKKE